MMLEPKKPEYGAAKLVLGLLSALCLVMVILGGLIFMFTALELLSARKYNPYGMGFNPATFVTMGLSLTASLLGLFGLAGVQISQAVIDNSITSWHILQELRKSGKTQLGHNEPQLKSNKPLVESGVVQKTVYTRDGKPVVVTKDASGIITAPTYIGIKEFSSFEEAADYFK